MSSLTERALRPRSSSMSMDDASHICEADTGSFKFIGAMKPLKDTE